MTISKKIIGGYAIVLAVLVIVMIVGFTSISRIQATYDHFLDVSERLVNGADELHFELRDQVAHYRAILLYPDLQKKYMVQLQDDHRQFATTVEKMRHLVISAEGLGMLNEIAALQEKHGQGQERAVELAQRGKQAEALALGIREVLPLTQALTDKTARFRERELKLEADGRAELEASVNRVYWLMGSISLLGLVLGLSMGYYLSRSITRQLNASINQLSSSSAEILATTSQVAAGAAETSQRGERDHRHGGRSEADRATGQPESATGIGQRAESHPDLADRRKSVEDSIQGMQRTRNRWNPLPRASCV